MTAFVRRNLTCLISKHSSSVCESYVSSSLSLHFFCTLRGKQTVTGPTVYDILLHKHQFSPEMASRVVSDLTSLKNPEKADSILSFLNESGFSKTQLEKIVIYRPRFLMANLENSIKPKIKIFQELGFASDDTATIITNNQSILHSSVNNSIIPSLSLLKGLLGSNYDVAKLLRLCPWFVTADLRKNMVPNIEFLKSCGIPMERIVIILCNSPRCLLIKPEIMKKCVEKAEEIGFNRSSKMFVYAIRIIASLSNETWELKMQAFRDLGFLDSDIMTMFRKAPLLFSISMEKIKKIKEILLGTGKFSMSCIVNDPLSLACSIEKRYKPRLEILGILESRSLIKNWPSLSTFCRFSDDKFFKKFVSPYLNDVGEVYMKQFLAKRD